MPHDDDDYANPPSEEATDRKYVMANAPSTLTELYGYIDKKEGGMENIAEYEPRNKKEDYLRAHDGQRKLLDIELNFLAEVVKKFEGATIDVIYAGSAPGHHIKFLVWFVDKIERWHLIDPKHDIDFKNESETRDKMFHEMLKKHFKMPEEIETHKKVIASKIEVYATMADSSLIETLATKIENSGGVTVFISDIRTDYDLSMPDEKIERIVQMDMQHQKNLLSYCKPAAALLKFRLPYILKDGMYLFETKPRDEIDEKSNMVKIQDPSKQKFKYLKGDVVLPTWGRCNTTEMRLKIFMNSAFSFEMPEDFEYDCKNVEKAMHYFNTHIREPIPYEAMQEEAIMERLLQVVDESSEVVQILKQKKILKPEELSKLVTSILGDDKKTKKQFQRYMNRDNVGSRLAAPKLVPYLYHFHAPGVFTLPFHKLSLLG